MLLKPNGFVATLRRRRAVFMIGLTLVAGLFAGCGSDKNTVTVGTKNFTEQVILGELFSQLIENKTKIKVERRFNLGGTFVCFSALQEGKIDLYPEYTGTGLTAVLKREPMRDEDEVYAEVKKVFRKEYGLRWLSPLGFNNTYTLTMRKAQADSLYIETISDLKAHQERLRCGFTSEFLERPDGYPGLKKKYNLQFEERPVELDPGLMYRAIRENQVDVICGFATDGRIPAYDLKTLQDDQGFFPPYQAAPLVRGITLEKFPNVKKALNDLKASIDDETMREMNFAVDQEGRKAQAVARQFLEEKGLL